MNEEKTDIQKPGGFPSNVKSVYRAFEEQPLRISQGDLLKSLSLNSFVLLEDGTEGMKTQFIQYGIILSQECDLEWDYQYRKRNHDKEIPTILICPAYLSEAFRLGTHIDGKKMTPKNSSEMKNIYSNNRDARYHYIPGDDDMKIPELIIDFKHFYTFDREYVYSIMKDALLVGLNELYREHLSQRFCNYLGRIGLPNILS